MSARRALRTLLDDDELTQVPSVYDGLTARLAEDAGFPAVSVTGNGISASVLGRPDLGLVSLAESVAVARNLAFAVQIPIIFDADTGYGNAVNVTRTTREMERAGVAAIKLEDQVTPKRCGVLDVPIPVVEEREFLGKIEAAVWAREDPDFVIVARTDAASTLGAEAAAQRARRAVELGADAAMVVGVRDPEQIRRVVDVVKAPLIIIVEERGPLAALSRAEIAALGFSVAVYPGLVRYSMVGAARRALATLRRDGSTTAVRADMATADEWNTLLGMDEYVEIEQRFVRGDGVAASG